MKYFVVSDIHGFYDQLNEALNEAGFDRDNPEHFLISCGDHFDRGEKPQEVMELLSSLPRKALIRGNHEDLLVECCNRGWFYDHDRSNGTLGTIVSMTMDFCQEYYKAHETYPELTVRAEECLRIVKPFLNELVPYYETEHFIFVHSWIPVHVNDDLPAHYMRGRSFSPHPNWRKASAEEWYQARWRNPFDMADRGFTTDKIIVCGHWHCSAGWAKAEGRSETGEDARFDPFYGDGFIAIDACTALSRKVNVLVLEDEPMGGYLYGKGLSSDSGRTIN